MSGSSPAPAKIAKRKPLRSRAAPANSRPVTPEERHHLIAEVAYFIAERRGFAPGSELEDWFRAEEEIARLMGGNTAG